MTDFVSLRADGRRIDFSTSTRDAARVKDWDWGNTTQAPTMAAGVDGGVPVGGTAALEGDRPVSLDVESTYGNVAGDGSGLAVNLAANDDGSAWSTAAGSGTLTVSRPVDVSDLTSASVDVACEVVASFGATVTVELVRGTTVVDSVVRAAGADSVVVVREDAMTISGTGPATLRAKVTGAPAGSTLKLRRVLVGVGLAGVYHDRYTPGASQRSATNRWGNGRLTADAAGWTLDASSGFTNAGSGRTLFPDGSGDYGWRMAGTNTTAASRGIGFTQSAALSAGWAATATAGESVTVSADLWVTALATTTQGFRFSAAFYDGSGAQVGSTLSGSYFRPGAGVTTRVSSSFTAPTGAVRVIVLAYVWTSLTETVDVHLTRLAIGDPLFTDGDLPGATWSGVPYRSGSVGPVGPASRPANGNAWSNAFQATIDRAIGAVRRGGAELVRSGDDYDEETWTFEINSAEYTAPTKGDHKRGHAEAKLTAKVRQLARLAKRELAGHTITVSGLPVFVADEPIPGSDDALGDVTVTWNGSRRDARVAVCESMPMVWDPTSAIPSWYFQTNDDSFGPEVLTGPLPVVAPAVVATYTSTFTGRARFAQRISVEVAATADLIINGRRVASSDVAPDPYEQDGKWRIVDFLVHSVSAGDKIGIALQAASGEGFIDRLIVTPNEFTSALMTQGDPVLPSDQVAGHDFSAGLPDATSIDGITALLGGTLVGASWKYNTIGFAARTTGSATDAMSTSSTFTLGTVGHVSADFRVSDISAFSGSGMVGLYATSGSRKVYATAVQVGSQEQLHFVVNDGSGTAYEVTAPTIDAGDGAVVDGRIQVDDAGRVTFLAASGGAKLRVVGAVHVPELAGGTYRASAFSPTATRLRVYSLRLLAGDTPYDDAVHWAAGATGRLVEGRLPRLRAGSTPYVFAHSAFTAGDSPIDANVHPTSYSVSLTPRVLTVPD